MPDEHVGWPNRERARDFTVSWKCRLFGDVRIEKGIVSVRTGHFKKSMLESDGTHKCQNILLDILRRASWVWGMNCSHEFRIPGVRQEQSMPTSTTASGSPSLAQTQPNSYLLSPPEWTLSHKMFFPPKLKTALNPKTSLWKMPEHNNAIICVGYQISPKSHLLEFTKRGSWSA